MEQPTSFHSTILPQSIILIRRGQYYLILRVLSVQVWNTMCVPEHPRSLTVPIPSGRGICLYGTTFFLYFFLPILPPFCFGSVMLHKVNLALWELNNLMKIYILTGTFFWVATTAVSTPFSATEVSPPWLIALKAYSEKKRETLFEQLTLLLRSINPLTA